ncbi:sulfite exporter TauE/SafE family protein [Nostoc sp. LEGE 06077]|uniref:nickel/cobalt transporter n=1 Tax=Nostoc sp. LEGE 06077 TaxID=915325 RepID=UPI001882F42B|nr:sulfite exporter TauE/SafE family protein [Nostoc sp. LEGE 06077]MBE9205108.1 sulfite exporter TauE/SafE family protein [Nostoc sp. LEGE 06077]
MLSGLLILYLEKPVLAHIGHGEFYTKILIHQQLTPSLIITGLGIAFLFGAGHALSPGHGKTMVAAYLVGSQGTPKQALVLGLVTTITHTLGVFILGLVALVAAQYILPETLYPILGLLSGLTVCGVGFWLLDERLTTHEHTHKHHHHHPPTKSLIALGIAGGIVPCPSALVLLLSAIALHQAAYGVVLVSAFSLGLASVLVAIGLVVVYAHQWIDHLPNSAKLLQNLSMVGAVGVIVIGAALTAISVI